MVDHKCFQRNLCTCACAYYRISVDVNSAHKTDRKAAVSTVVVFTIYACKMRKLSDTTPAMQSKLRCHTLLVSYLCRSFVKNQSTDRLPQMIVTCSQNHDLLYTATKQQLPYSTIVR